jgi:hypothetical protein
MARLHRGGMMLGGFSAAFPLIFYAWFSGALGVLAANL